VKSFPLPRAVFSALVVVLFLVGGSAVRAGTEIPPGLRVETNATGEIGLDAHGATLDDTLNAIASKTGVDIVIERGLVRPPVNVVVSMAPVEYVLRQILRGRNYALIYDGEDTFVSQVIILPPSAARPNPPPRPPFRRR